MRSSVLDQFRFGNYCCQKFFKAYISLHLQYFCRQLSDEAWKNSIVYVCLNQLVIAFASKVCSLFELPSAVMGMIVLVVSLAILYLADRVFMETKLKKLLGK